MLAEATGLAEDYSALAAARLKLSVRAYSVAAVLGAATGALGLLGLCHLGYGVAGVAIATVPAVHETAVIVLVAAGGYFILAGLFAALTVSAAKRAGREVKRIFAGSGGSIAERPAGFGGGAAAARGRML
jgi:ABC-type amino acid transport system permease subunit